MKCPDCGRHNPEGTPFCLKCGTALPIVPASLSVDSPTGVLSPSTQTGPPSSKSLFLPLTIGVLILGGAAILVYQKLRPQIPLRSAPDGISAKTSVDFDFSQIKIQFQPTPPPYPAMARIARIQGTVIVEILIGLDGVPLSAHSIEGPPQLRPTAEAFAMQFRFEPARLNGQPVNAKFKLTMPFKLR